MKCIHKICLFVSVLNFIVMPIFGQDNQDRVFFEGPHVFYHTDSLIIKYAIDSVAFIHKVKMEEQTVIDGFYRDSTYSYFVPTKFNHVPDHYPIAQKIFVVSDIHGQYGIFQDLLKNNGIIDSNNMWIWENGHLVILGDVFDKGTQVHESLWLIYNLELQAKKVGGSVHYLLGNHEVKALRGDLKYVRENYYKLAETLSITIPELYYDNTFWGRWLRSKNILTKIGSILFVHGGIHPTIVEKYSSISDINIIMRENLDLSLDEIKRDSVLSLLFRKNGPIRYRGFFQPDSLPEVTNDQLTAILYHFNVERIIVGHTSGEHIYTSHNNRILCVDSGIMRGLGGEGLLILNDRYYLVDNSGMRERIF